MKISVIGATGDMGAAITFCLMQRALAREIAMLDTDSSLLAQQANDMQTAAYLSKSAITYGDYEMLADSEIVIVASDKCWDLPETYMEDLGNIAGAIKNYSPLATVIMVGEAVEPSAHFLQSKAGLRPDQVLGYTLNDTLRFKQLLRSHLSLNAQDTINAVVMGEYGKAKVTVFDYVYINGQKFSIDEETRYRITDADRAAITEFEYARQTAGRKPAWSTALGVSEMVAALNASRPVPFVCSTYLTGQYGYEGVFCGMPVKLGLGLLQEITPLALAPETKAALDYAVETIRLKTAAVF